MPDDLLAAIDAAEPDVCAICLADLDERSRRVLYPAVSRRIDELDARLSDASAPARKETFHCLTAARVALLGVATLGELKKARPWTFVRAENAASTVLANRRPEWLPDWAEFELGRTFRTWPVVRTLVRSGALPFPATEFYILGMIVAPNHVEHPRQFLERDPQLLEKEFWGLFEHEGSGELSLAARDKYVPDAATWWQAILAMAADGVIDRSRLLAATLDALQRDFAPFRAGWFSRLHEALKPSATERVALRDRYLDLLVSRVPATVAFAMKALVSVEKAGAFEAVALERLAPAFDARDKGTVQRALALAGRIARKGNAEISARVANLAARALGHESAEIQTAALALAGTDSSRTSPYLPLLAPSVRAGLGATEPAAEAAIPRAPAASCVAPITSLNELVEAFAAILENQGPPVEIERVMDGVARLGIEAAVHDSGFDRLTGALAKRAEKLLARSGAAQPRVALAGLALAWARRVRVPSPQSEKHLGDFLLWRLWNLAEQAAQRIRQPLLSLPSFANGRIHPGEFDRRVAALTPEERLAAESDPESLLHLDFLQARLRTAGDPGSLPKRVIWKKETWDVQGRTYSHYQPALLIEGSRQQSRFDPAGLTAIVFWSSLEMKRWCSTVNPHGSEDWFAAGCCALGGNLEWWQAEWSTRAYLEPLLDPQTSMGPIGALLVALGLGAKEAGESGLAADALIAASADGRLDGRAVGLALREAASSGAIKFARWAKQLDRVAQAGNLQARTVFTAIEALFEAGAPAEPGDFGRLVELQFELAHLTGLRLTNASALRTLATLKTGGKTGRAASQLLALS